MKKKLTILAFLFLAMILPGMVSAQSFQAESLSNLGNASWDILSDITFDTEGNYYIAGSFSDVITINGDDYPSLGQRDIFLVKSNAEHQVQWVRRIGDTGDEHAYSIVCDNENSIYLTGAFSETLNIGGPYTATGITDLFLIKYNTAGTHQWTKAFSSTAPAKKSFLRKDAEGNIWLAGNFSKQITLVTSSFTTETKSNIYIAMFNTSGELQESFHLNNVNPIVLKDFAIDNNSSLYFAGYFENRVDLEAFAFDAIGKKDAFVAKCSSSGAVSWLKVAGSYYNDEANCISLDQNGNVLIAGDFKDEISFFSATTTTIETTKSNEVFLASYAAADGELNWAKELGGNSSNYSSSIAMAENNKFYLNGTYKGELKGGATPINSLKQSKDIFVGRFDTEGNEETMTKAGGDYEDQTQIGYSISEKSLFIGGQFSTNFNLIDKSINNQNYQDVFYGELIELVEPVDCGAFPVVDLGDDVKNICAGSTYTIDAGPGFDTYIWNGIEGSRTLTVSTPGNYTITASYANGCTSTGSVDVTISPNPIVDLGPDINVSSRETYVLGTVGTFESYLWSNNSTESTLTVEGNSISVTTVYSLLVTDENGCVGNDEITLTVGRSGRGIANNNNENTLLLSEHQDEALKSSGYNVYPNPNNGVFFISVSIPQKIKSMALFDINGNKIKSIESINSSPHKVELSNLPKGIYILRVFEGESIKEFKIIHQ